MVLEEFFGSEQLTKLDMFKKQISTENLAAENSNSNSKDKMAGGESLPQIVETAEGEASPIKPLSPPPTSMAPDQVKLRIANKRFSSDANRISCDVASEMEKLRARLQETAKQELAEFDRRFSPKFRHQQQHAGSSDVSNSHSRQGSLDSSVPTDYPTTSPRLPPVGHGHTRQHSLPIDPKHLRSLQGGTDREGVLTHQKTKAANSPLSSSSFSNIDRNARSPTPPLLYGHVRQVSGSSVSSNEGAAFSPPRTPVLQLASSASQPESHGQYFHYNSHSASGKGSSAYQMASSQPMPVQQHYPAAKQVKAPGMARMGSDGSFNNYPYNRHLSGSASSLTRTSPEGDGQLNGNRTRVTNNTAHSSQPHYSTSVIKRGNGSKRSSLERSSLERSSMDRGSFDGNMPPQITGSARDLRNHDSRVQNGRPNAYEHPKRRSYGEDTDGHHPMVPLTRGGSNISVGSSGASSGGRYPQFSPPRMEGNIPASPRMSRAPDRRATVTQGSGGSAGVSSRGQKIPTQRSLDENIQPYSTSAQLKSQMGFNYTPFSQQQQRSQTVSASDAPRLTRNHSGKNTWI